MANVVDLSMILVVVLFVIRMSSVTVMSEADVPEWVRRRQSLDIYNFLNSSHMTCSIDNSTYLVDERQCVKDQELFDGN